MSNVFQNKEGLISIPKIVGTVAISLGALTTAWNSFVVIEQTERGIDYRMGKMTTENAAQLRQPGLSLKTPFLTSVTKVRVDLQDRVYPKQETFTKDNQTIHSDLAVTFRIPEGNLVSIFKNNPDFESKLENTVLNGTKALFGQQEAQNIAQNRGEIVKSITEETQKEVAQLLGIEVVKVQLPNFDFDKQFKKAVADAANAKAVLNQKQTELEQQKVERDKTGVNAEGAATKQRLEAEAAAYATKQAADASAYKTTTESTAQAEANLRLSAAEATGYKRISAAIGPGNVSTYIKTKQWDGAYPKVMSSGGGSPIIVPVPGL
jgi:membrane protease subunit HflC